MPGRYVEAGDGYDWVEDPVAAPAPAPAAIDYSNPNWMSNLPISLAAPTYGLPPGAVIESTPGDLHPVFTPDSNYKTIDPSFLKDIPRTIDKNSYDPAAYTSMVGGDETGSGAYSQTSPVMRDIGGNMQGAYDPDSGKLQNIYYKDQSKGGYWDTSGNFIPYQSSGGGFGSFFSGMFSGIEDLATSNAVKTIAPMMLTGGLGGPAGVGEMMGLGTGMGASAAGGAALGAGTAALTGQDILKGAFTGGIGGAGANAATGVGTFLGAGKELAPILGGAVLGGGTAALTGQNIGSGALLGGLTNAGGVKIADTGVNLGQVGAAAKVIDNIGNGNLLAAVTGATNLAGAGNTQIGDTGLTINDLAKDINLANAFISGNPQLVSNALFSVANSAANSAVQADANASKAIDPYFQTGAGTGAVSTEYAANDVGTQQLIDALTNVPSAAGPSVQVASSEPDAALTALQERIDADAGRAGGAGSGTYFDSLGRMHVLDEGDDPEVEQARTEAAIAAETLTEGAGPAGQTTVPTQAEQQPAVEDFIKRIEQYQAPEPTTQTVEQVMASEPAPAASPVAPETPVTVPTQAEQQPEVEELIKQLEQYQNPEPTVEQIRTAQQIMAGQPDRTLSQVAPAGQVTVPAQAEQQNSIDDLLAQLQEYESTSSADLQSQLGDAVNPINQRISDLVASGATAAEAQNQAILELTQGQTGLGTQISDVQSNLESQLSDQNQSFMDALMAQGSDYETALQAAMDLQNNSLESYQSETGEALTGLGEQISGVQTGLESKITDLSDAQKEQYDALVSMGASQAEAYDAALAAQGEQFTGALDARTQELLDLLEQGRTETGESLTGLGSQISDLSNTQKEQYDALIELGASQQEAYDAALQSQGEQFTGALDERTQELLDILGQNKTETGEALTGLGSQISDLSDAQKEQYDALIELGASQQEAYDAALQSQGEQFSSDLDARTQELLDILGKSQESTKTEFGNVGTQISGLGSALTSFQQKTEAAQTAAAAQAKAQAAAQAKKDAAAAAAAAAAQGYMPSVGDVAHIKSLESLFGPILGTLPAEQTNEKQDDSLSALEGMDQEYASGGHVDDFSVEALLHILRS